MTIGGIHFDLKLTLVIILTTVVPMLDYYGHSPTGTKAYDRFLFYFVLSIAVIYLIFREQPAAYGLQLGNWREGLFWTAVGVIGMGALLWYLARTPAMASYYNARAPQSTFRLIYLTGVELFAWEFVWRGLLLFALARVVGPGPAIFLQAVPFAFMHLGKPEIETLSTIFGGAAFAFVAWRTQSMLYPWLIHWYIASWTMLIASGRLG